MKTITVTIFKKNVEKSNFLSNKDCSLARALNRLENISNVSVGGTYFRFKKDNRYKLIQLDKECTILSSNPEGESLSYLIIDNYNDPQRIKFSFKM